MKYRYSDRCAPDAPFILVTLRQPGGTLVTGELPAQIDCGADRSVIPLELAEALQLPPVSRVVVAGLGGHTRTLAVYHVEIRSNGLPNVVANVAATDEPHVLLGRDYLAPFRVTLDGPTQSVSIEWPPATEGTAP